MEGHDGRDDGGHQQTRTDVFIQAVDGLFRVTAIIAAVGIPLALMLRSGPRTAGPSVQHVG